MQSVIFFTKSISFTGGKEKVLAGLANYLCDEGYGIKIITYDGSTESAFALNDKITVCSLPAKSIKTGKYFAVKLNTLFADIRLYAGLKKIIGPYDYFICTDYLIAAIVFLAFRGSAKKIIVWEHLTYMVTISRFWKFIKRKIYPRMHAIVALNKEEAAFYKKYGDNVQCIPNPVEQQKLVSNSHGRFFIWVGALTEEKGAEELVTLAKLLKEKKILTPINIYGKGEEEIHLHESIAACGLKEILILKGIEKNISLIYRNAAALLLLSKHECLPTVVLEAFSFGVPVIAFDCPTGPRSIISDAKDGYLIKEGEVRTMAEKMLSLLNDDQLYCSLSSNAFNTSSLYNPAMIYPLWKKLLA